MKFLYVATMLNGLKIHLQRYFILFGIISSLFIPGPKDKIVPFVNCLLSPVSQGDKINPFVLLRFLLLTMM